MPLAELLFKVGDIVIASLHPSVNRTVSHVIFWTAEPNPNKFVLLLIQVGHARAHFFGICPQGMGEKLLKVWGFVMACHLDTKFVIDCSLECILRVNFKHIFYHS